MSNHPQKSGSLCSGMSGSLCSGIGGSLYPGILNSPIRSKLWSKKWVIYAKQPFGSSKSVIEYLGRYTNKIAISNHRIKGIDENTVTFTYKDYKSGAVKKQMTLTHEEFIRRFALHILPKRFVKIRHCGILSSTWKRQKLKALQEKMQMRLPELKAIEQPERICSVSVRPSTYFIISGNY